MNGILDRVKTALRVRYAGPAEGGALGFHSSSVSRWEVSCVSVGACWDSVCWRWSRVHWLRRMTARTVVGVHCSGATSVRSAVAGRSRWPAWCPIHSATISVARAVGFGRLRTPAPHGATCLTGSSTRDLWVLSRCRNQIPTLCTWGWESTRCAALQLPMGTASTAPRTQVRHGSTWGFLYRAPSPAFVSIPPIPIWCMWRCRVRPMGRPRTGACIDPRTVESRGTVFFI